VHRKLQVGQLVELRLRQPAGFGGALTALETAAQRQPYVVETQFSQQFPDFIGQFARGADLAQGMFCRRCSRAKVEELAAFKFPATRRPFGIDGTSTRRGIEGGTWLSDARAAAVEKR